MQVGVTPVEQDNPVGLLQTSNTAFTKLSTLLVYLVNDIDRNATQVQAPSSIRTLVVANHQGLYHWLRSQSVLPHPVIAKPLE